MYQINIATYLILCKNVIVLMVTLTTVLINKFSMKHFRTNIYELLTELYYV